MCLWYQNWRYQSVKMLKIDKTRRLAQIAHQHSWSTEESLTMYTLIFVSHTVYRRSQEIGDAWVRPSLIGTMTLLTQLETCSYSKFGRCRSDHLGVGRGGPKIANSGAPPLGRGIWLTPRNTFLSYMCYIPWNFVNCAIKTRIHLPYRPSKSLAMCPFV